MKLKPRYLLAAITLSGCAMITAGFAQEGEGDADTSEPGFRPHHGGPGVGRGSGRRGGFERGPRGPRISPSERQLARLDSDADGVISLEEFLTPGADQADRLFERLDTDGDGLISATEAEPPARPQRPQRRPRPEPSESEREAVRQCLADSGVDVPRRPEVPEDRFAWLDADGNGSVDFTEVSAMLNERASARFADLDSDASGGITQEELQAERQADADARRARRQCLRDVMVGGSGE